MAPPLVIIPAIRFSGSVTLSRRFYHRMANRAAEAASYLTIILNRRALICPWIRIATCSQARRPIPIWWGGTNSTIHTVRELKRLLSRLPTGTEVIILALGVDGLTTEISNLKKLPEWGPRLKFCLIVMVERQFCARLRNGHQVNLQDPDGIDLFPPTRRGTRLGIFRVHDLLEEQTRQARELLALWGRIQWGKMSVNLPYSAVLKC